jgi:hypothetical protein
MGKLFYLVCNLFNYLFLIINLQIAVVLIAIIPGYCSQQVRLGLRVIGSSPPLNLLCSVIVKLFSQADQVPYWGGELAFWTGDAVFPNNRGLKSQMLSRWLEE